MSSGGPTARPVLADLIAAGGIEYTVNLLNLGYQRARIQGYLQREFAGATQQTLGALIDRARASRSAAFEHSVLARDERLRAGQLLRPDPGCTSWSYQVSVAILNPDQEEVTRHQIDVTSTGALSQEELDFQAQILLDEMTRGERGKKSPDKALKEGYSVISVDVLGVRRTC